MITVLTYLKQKTKGDKLAFMALLVLLLGTTACGRKPHDVDDPAGHVAYQYPPEDENQ